MSSQGTIEQVMQIVRESRGILSIEGNIGVGKSTLLSAIQAGDHGSKRVVFMQEPVDQWSQIRDPESGETILSCFYRDTTKYAFMFQVMAFTSRLATFKRLVKENPDYDLIVCERSLEADRLIFAQMMRDQKSMEPMAYQVYETLYFTVVDDFPVDKVVYLDASPETCLARIGKRCRPGESGIELAYLETCKTYYDVWLGSRENTVRIDVN